MTTIEPTGARQRLIAAAAEAFYRAGIVATSVDDIAAAAGVSKPTLYAKFGSKSALLEAALRRWDQRRRALLSTVMDTAEEAPTARILAVFDWLSDWFAEVDFRGCALVNAAAEVGEGVDAAAAIAARNKRWVYRRLVELARSAELEAPEDVAAGLVLLIEGATTMAMLGEPEAAGRQAHAAARRLLTAHGARLDAR